MNKSLKKFLSILLTISLLWGGWGRNVFAEDDTISPQVNDVAIEISAPSAILMEATTGTICYAKDAQKPLPMASVTKVMTLLLIFEALDNGKLSLDQQITISDHAASMGGSQVFLEPGEIQTVETLIKCISVASANDAAVAMAEAVAGTEEQFVALMNQRAKELHMEHTNFVNCCGLDHKDHYSCAKDLALVSRALITAHPQIYDYCKIWQEDITHTTKKGTTPFTLTNTNKLMKQYPYATGLKTGSTSVAKFCLSATAEKDGLEFIAVIMAAETPKDRFRDATKLLEYGFANTAIYRDSIAKKSYDIPVIKGTKQSVTLKPQSDFSFLAMKGEQIANIKKKEVLPKELTAPFKKGTAVGKIEYYIGDNKIGSVPIVTECSVKKATYSFYIKSLLSQLSLSDKK
ncbi:MAG: D-alanyl-D-alanine carboxypeptidase [Lachnospiraceae bacterium]|nr:D-alanyl-D-alanine carboxypeptidase [Lachnospiraceae bacterium]